MEREGIHGSALCVSMLRSCQACDGWLTSLCSNSPLNSPPPCFCKFVKVVSTEHHKKEETRCSSALKSRQYSKIIFICARKYGSLMFLSSADVHIFHSELIPSLPSYIFPLCCYSTHSSVFHNPGKHPLYRIYHSIDYLQQCLKEILI